MKVIYLTLLIVSIVIISSMAQKTNQSAQDQEEIQNYTKIAEKIAEHQEDLV